MKNISYKVNPEVSKLLEKYPARFTRTTYISVKADYSKEMIANFNLASNNYCLWSKNNFTMFRTNVLNNYERLLIEIQGYKILEIADGITENN